MKEEFKITIGAESDSYLYCKSEKLIELSIASDVPEVHFQQFLCLFHQGIFASDWFHYMDYFYSFLSYTEYQHL